MADLRTEEEQIELLKKWWKESGVATVSGVMFAIFVWLGWTAWQNHIISRIEEAGSLYQGMSLSFDASDVSAAQKNELLASELRDKYSESPYAVFGALSQAKYYAENKRLPEAQKSLVWALDHVQHSATELRLLVALRLAKLQFSQADYSGAIATLESGKDPGAFSSSYFELKGDVLLAQGQIPLAAQAYSDAISALEKSGLHERKQDIEMKLSNLSGANSENHSHIQGSDS